jgi:hypothetical protein
MAFGKDIIYTRNCIGESNKRRLRVRKYMRLLSIEKQRYVALKGKYSERKAMFEEACRMREEKKNARLARQARQSSDEDQEHEPYDSTEFREFFFREIRGQMGSSLNYIRYLQGRIQANLD